MPLWRSPPAPALALALLAACGNLDTTQIKQGAYQLTLNKVADTCDPARLSGDFGPVSLAPHASSVTVPIPQGDANATSHPQVLVEVPASQALTERTLYTDCSARSTFTFELLSASDPVEVRYTESWSVAAACATSYTHIPGRPKGDCDAQTILRYKLLLECESPCALGRVADTGSPFYECVCP